MTLIIRSLTSKEYARLLALHTAKTITVTKIARGKMYVYEVTTKTKKLFNTMSAHFKHRLIAS